MSVTKSILCSNGILPSAARAYISFYAGGEGYQWDGNASSAEE